MIIFLDTLLGLIVACSLKAIGLALVAWLSLTCLSLFRDYNANLHHRVWTGVLLAMLALPILQFAVPPIAVPIPAIVPSDLAAAVDEVSALNEQASGIQPTATLQSPSLINPDHVVSHVTPEQIPVEQVYSPLRVYASRMLNWRTLLAAVYVVITALLLIRLLLGLWSVNRLYRRATRVQIEAEGETSIYELPGNDIPFTVGLFRPTILLPEHWRDWTPEVLASVLQHEQTHADRRDPLVAFLAELGCCLYWFHPIAWLARKRLASLAEDVCDDSVLAQSEDRPGYASHLLEVASKINGSTRLSGAQGIAMAKKDSQLERRIDLVLDPSRSLSRRLGWNGVVVALLCVLASVAFAAIQDSEEKEPQASTIQTEIIDQSELTELEFDRVKKVKVVDVQGQPIEGARITVTGGGYINGTGVGWPFPKVSKPTATTGAAGIAELKFPTYFQISERIRPSILYCEIMHPDYCKFESASFSVTDKNIEIVERQILSEGAKVYVTAKVGGKSYFGTDLYLVSGSFSGRLESSDDKPQVRLPAGSTMVRVVALPPGQPTLFGKATLVEVDDGEELNLEVDLRRGVTVTGRLDDTVPRPVVNARPEVLKIAKLHSSHFLEALYNRRR
jgi:beta-lactamase regulating signal transducer with metallopeptidase domain